MKVVEYMMVGDTDCVVMSCSGVDARKPPDPDPPKPKARKARRMRRPNFGKFLSFAVGRFPWCQFCGKAVAIGGNASMRQATTEHMIPRCHRGPDTWDNLAVACRQCNEAHGIKPKLIRCGPSNWAKERKLPYRKLENLFGD